MPSRNITRLDKDDSYYHVYGRGARKDKIYHGPEDKDYFLYLLSRHLSKNPETTKAGYSYPHYRGVVELLTYCLMDNHFHLLFYQKERGNMAHLMQSILTAYTVYFNKKYQQTGPLLESRYKASLVDRDDYLLHVSRYILLNPRSWKYYKHSAVIPIRKGIEPEWLQTEKLLDLHGSREAFLEFVADYEENKKMLSELKYQLANL